MINVAKTNLSRICFHFLQIVVAAFLSFSILGCTPNVPAVTVSEAAELFTNQQAVMIDVREQDEWDEQHIEGTIFIPLDQVESRISELAQYKDSTVIMQCRSGRRSNLAAETLLKAGFSKVYNLEGGILAWDEQGLPTVKGAAKTPK